jgi:hypothetical protein
MQGGRRCNQREEEEGRAEWDVSQVKTVSRVESESGTEGVSVKGRMEIVGNRTDWIPDKSRLLFEGFFW